MECPKVKKGWWIFKWSETTHTWGKWEFWAMSDNGYACSIRHCSVCGFSETKLGERR